MPSLQENALTTSITLGRCARHLLATVFTAVMLTACGGGGDDGNAPAMTAGDLSTARDAAAAPLGVRVHAPQCEPVESPGCGPTLPPTQ
jgi:hypothetical protein